MRPHPFHSACATLWSRAYPCIARITSRWCSSSVTFVDTDFHTGKKLNHDWHSQIYVRTNGQYRTGRGGGGGGGEGDLNTPPLPATLCMHLCVWLPKALSGMGYLWIDYIMRTFPGNLWGAIFWTCLQTGKPHPKFGILLSMHAWVSTVSNLRSVVMAQVSSIPYDVL